MSDTPRARNGCEGEEMMSDIEMEYAETLRDLAEAQEELNDKRKFCYAVEQALDGLKGDYVEIIVALRKDAEKYRRLNNDAFN